MRTILFRGKRIDNGEWVEGDYLRERIDRPDKLSACIVQTHRSFDVDPETVGQFTGLLDKNRKKIFEGDIAKVEGEDLFINGDTSPVGFYYGEFHLTIAYDLTSIPLSGFDTIWKRNGYKGDESTASLLADIEIIGNIHDKGE